MLASADSLDSAVTTASSPQQVNDEDASYPLAQECTDLGLAVASLLEAASEEEAPVGLPVHWRPIITQTLSSLGKAQDNEGGRRTTAGAAAARGQAGVVRARWIVESLTECARQLKAPPSSSG
jgi:hypothetical protein